MSDGPLSTPQSNLTVGSRDVAYARATAEEALLEYARALRFWNAPDDAHTRLQLRRLGEQVITEALADA